MAPSPLVVRSPELKPLGALAVVQKGGLAYYRELIGNPDPIIVAGAWCALFDAKLVPRPMAAQAIVACRHAAVRSRAFAYFTRVHEHALAKAAAETAANSPGDLEQEAMLAELDQDNARVADVSGRLYLATGDLARLSTASERAELAGGWRAALQWALRAVIIAPLNPTTIMRLFAVLESSAQPDLMEEVGEVLRARNLHLPTTNIFLAAAAQMRGDGKLCLSRLKPLDDGKIVANPTLAPYLGAVRALRAQAEENLGNYRAAYEAYLALNVAERAPGIDPTFAYKAADIRGKLAIPALPPDGQPDVIQMLGFPRSGTTLLENALAAHPAIETFEETAALNVATDRIEGVLFGHASATSPEETFLKARAGYFDEINSLRRKPEARVLIDKLPIRTADTAFISKLFPEWRYIFSIRHPYDVVLSCFKQRFVPNPSMENFRTIEDASRLYDFAMSEWFKVHTMDDPKVICVRYDDLVTDFDRVTGGVLDFLGLPWDDAVRDFSKAAENRAAKTPSYQKVRQGLSIGVQTQWRNYGFVFQSDAAKPLRKWVEFFGYPLE
jgi:hypothetical protein